MTEVKIRRPYEKRLRVPTATIGESRTKQSFKEECNINNIMKRYEKTGVVNHLAETQGNYGSYIDAPSYHAAMSQICRANEMFGLLPSKVRYRFDNDPARFLAFVHDPENAAELVEMGLATAQRSEPEPDSGRLTDPGAAGAAAGAEVVSSNETLRD